MPPNPTTRHNTPLPLNLSMPTLMLPVAKGNPPHLLSIYSLLTPNIVSPTIHYNTTIPLRQWGGAGPAKRAERSGLP